MAILNFDQLLKELKNKIYRPVYLLMGDEPYFIDQVSDFIEKNILDENERDFNQSVYYGKDTDVKLLITHARRYPMMSNYQVIILKEAADLKKIEDLAIYLNNPLKSTILVICHKYEPVEKSKALYKLCDKQGIVFESKKLYENKVIEWVATYLHKNGYTIDSLAMSLLYEYIGDSLSKLSNELDKMMLLVPVGTKITVDHIEKNIGISKDFNVFEYIRALGKRDISKAIQIAIYIGQHPKENRIDSIMARLYEFFTRLMLYQQSPVKTRDAISKLLKINPYFFDEYQKAALNYNFMRIIRSISVAAEFDGKLKGIGATNTSNEDLMVEMTCKILMY